jgi:hypothetical protein
MRERLSLCQVLLLTAIHVTGQYARLGMVAFLGFVFFFQFLHVFSYACVMVFASTKVGL